MGGGAEAGEGGEVDPDCVRYSSLDRLTVSFLSFVILFKRSLRVSAGALPANSRFLASLGMTKPFRAYASYFHYRD